MNKITKSERGQFIKSEQDQMNKAIKTERGQKIIKSEHDQVIKPEQGQTNNAIKSEQDQIVDVVTQQKKIVDAVAKQKKKRSRPDLVELQTPHCEPGEMSKMLGQTMTIAHWDPIDTDDPEQIERRINQYHEFCYQNDMKPSVVGMALAIGVDRTTLWKWENGVQSNKPLVVRNLLKKGREINELMLDQLMQNGKLNPVTGIFLMKNHHGYKDQADVVITPNNPVEGRSEEEIRKRYLEALPMPDDQGT